MFMLYGGGITGSAQTTPVGFSIADASVNQKDTFTVTLNADSVLTGREIYSFRFYITYNPSYLRYEGADVAGSVLADWGMPVVNSSNAGTLILTGAGATPLSGSGEMLSFTFVAMRGGTKDISFNTAESYLNERNPSAIFENSSVVIAAHHFPDISPDSYKLFVGDMVKMSVTGGVSPFVYDVENKDVAVMSDATTVRGTGPGTTRIFVTDALGDVSYTTGVFDVRSVKMGVEEVSVWPRDTFYLPLKINVAPGTNIHSGKIILNYDSRITALTNMVYPGDYQVSLENKASSGKVTVTFAGTTPVTGNGILCYLGFRANRSGSSRITFGDMRFNEILYAYTTADEYHVNVYSLPVLAFSPDKGDLMWGTTRKITVTNGTAPYSYSVSDEAFATIDYNGNIYAKSGGEVTVTAVDAHGATGKSGIFTINDCLVAVNNADGVLGSDTKVAVTISQVPESRSIYGFKALLDIDTDHLDLIRVEPGSPSLLVEHSQNGNSITVTGASTNGVTSGAICILVFRIKNELLLGETTPVNITSFSANERTIFSELSDGYVKRTEQASYIPVANAGSDFSVPEGMQAQLNGSSSYDYDGDELTYNWTVPSGIILNDETAAMPVFSAPMVDADTRYDLILVVNDGTSNSEPDTVTVTVKQLNRPPVADAGEDNSYIEGSSVSLDGSSSFDPDGDVLSFSWSSLDGIILFDAAGDSPSFILPQVTENTIYHFVLTVNDGTVNSAPDTVEITALQVNKKPVAFAGSDLSVNENETASLDGSMSYDDDGDTITYLWSAPVNVTLSATNIDKPSFTAPAVHRDSVLRFILTVNDGNNDSDPDEVLVTVKNTDVLSAEAGIDSVMFNDLTSFTVDKANAVVVLTLPYGYDITTLAPEFKLSDEAVISPESGTLHDFSMPVYYTVTAEDRVTQRTWKVVVDRPVKTYQRSVEAGWNWISLNVKPSDLSIDGIFGGMTFQDLDYVKSTEYSSIYYSSNGWFGDLTSFPEKRIVKMKKNTAEVLSVEGEEINPEITSIPLVPGWNSIAYLLRSDAAVNAAFNVSSIPDGNIVLKGIDGSSVYYSGTGWTGEIDTLRVLSGYVINVEGAGGLKYAPSAALKSSLQTVYTREQLLETYHLNPASYDYSSTLIAEVLPSAGSGLVQQGDLLLAYSGSECRGVSEAGYVSELGKYVFVITYYSNTSGEDISFKLASMKYAKELEINHTELFKPDNISGSASSPLPLLVDITTEVGKTAESGNITVYPNPVKDMVRVSSFESIHKIVLFNSLGVAVYESYPDSKTVGISVVALKPGIYVIRVEYGNYTVIRKIIKSGN